MGTKFEGRTRYNFQINNMKEPESIETGNSNRIKNKDLNELQKIGFKDFNIDIADLVTSTIQKGDKVSLPKKKDFEYNSVVLDLGFNDDFVIDLSSSSENKINLKRQENLKNEFTNNLISCLIEEIFEFGFKSKSELIIKEQFSTNTLATRNWLNEIFIDNYQNEKILIGLLRIIGRFEQSIIFPQGQTMALAALAHRNDEIKELGIRAFENWNSPNSLEVLKNVQVEVKWLNEYLNQVIEDLKEEHVIIG